MRGLLIAALIALALPAAAQDASALLMVMGEDAAPATTNLLVAVDSSSGGNNGTVSTNTLLTLDGSDWVANFTGAETIEIGADVCPTGAGVRSVLVWRKNTTATRTTLFYAGAESSPNRFDFEHRSAKANLNWFGGALASVDSVTAGATWSLLAVCYDGTDLFVSVNGGTAGTTTVALNTSAVGKNWIGVLNGTAQFANTPISSVAIYNTCLTTGNLAAIYAAGQTVAPSATVSAGVVGEWLMNPLVE